MAKQETTTIDCPVNFDFVRELLRQKQVAETTFVRKLFPKFQGQGLAYFEKRAWNDIKAIMLMADELNVPAASLLKGDTSASLANTGTAGIVGNGNHIGSVNVNTDLTHENKTLKLQVEMLNQLITAKDETIASKNSELSQLRSQKDEITALYEKAMMIFNNHPAIKS